MNERTAEISRSTWRPILMRILSWLAAAVACALALLVVLNASVGAWNRRLHPPPGRFFKVGGFSMRLDCTGTGAPTIVLDSGLGDDGLQWRRVQPALSQLTRVCSYDRAGYGWSDPRPGPRDSIHIVDELHSLLQEAGITGRIVLMGHSAGGLHIREYATKYPADIVGLVFVDASTPAQITVLPAELVAMDDDLLWPKVQTMFGIPRMQGRCGQHDWTGMGTVPSDSPQFVAWLKADDCMVSVLNTTVQEERGFAPSCHEVAGTGPFGKLPILIFSEDPQYRPSFWEPARLFPVFAVKWNALQEGLKGLSTRSRRIIARRSSHYVQIDRPELVISNVGHMIRSLQGAEPEPLPYGTTTTE